MYDGNDVFVKLDRACFRSVVECLTDIFDWVLVVTRSANSGDYSDRN